MEIYGKKKCLLKPLKTSEHGNESKCFPFFFFYKLLELAEELWEKLVYLLLTVAIEKLFDDMSCPVNGGFS